MPAFSLFRPALAGAIALGLSFGSGTRLSAETQDGPGRDGRLFETGIEMISAPKTLIKGLHRLFIGRSVGRGFYLGQAVYSSAVGDAGGAFFWGFELVKAIPLQDRLSLTASAFVGGGGGAAQVVGDGLFKRVGVGLSYKLTDRLGLGVGASYIDISGARIKGPAFGLNLSYRFGGTEVADGEGLDLRSVALGGSAMVLSGRRRSGGDQPDVGLVGAEAAFHLGRNRELVVFADGGAKGAEGYMQIMGGLRKRVSFGRLSGFGQLNAGFGGGGDVDTGGGLLVGLGGGLAFQIAEGADLELGVTGVMAPDGDMAGVSASLRLVRVFGRAAGSRPARPQDWAFTTGLSAQVPNAGFHKPGTTGKGTVIMQETSLDMMLGKHVYLTGNAQTTMDGGVAGYAIGLVGLGWTGKIAPRWDISFEGHVGAAGGGGVNTAGGLIAGLRAEVDYALSDKVKLSLGIGQLRSLKGGGMAPAVVQLGLKLPFTTH